MLYRFREAQAAELGLGTRSDRRPRMASACKSLRECERWRGEILREISRKVSKIQDAGLTDYEVRDLNDEINKLMREKRHWENQIIALGGANYRRNVAMLDDDGREVPGTKGYKYFGRAKELPGVKELFESRKKEEDEENATHIFYKKFTNQGPAYFGDLDEADGELLRYEEAAEQQEWEEAHEHLREVLGLPSDAPIPRIPRRAAGTHSSAVPPSDNPPPATSDGKRKALTMMARRCRNLTATLRSAQNQTPQFPHPQPWRIQMMRLSPRRPMLVRQRPTFPSYPWKVSCHQRCPPKKKWRVCYLSCGSVYWSKSTLEISYFFSSSAECFP
ncbi:Isy1-like splicing family-domain-containing protein [Lactifluus volemus]|nr:Isy1-like splicing family-domain-containing protein [Lactifluus volemus]